MELNPYKELDLKDQEGLNQLNLDHDATIQSDTNVTFNTIKSESVVESKTDLIYKQKSNIKPKKGQ